MDWKILPYRVLTLCFVKITSKQFQFLHIYHIYFAGGFLIFNYLARQENCSSEKTKNNTAVVNVVRYNCSEWPKLFLEQWHTKPCLRLLNVRLMEHVYKTCIPYFVSFLRTILWPKRIQTAVLPKILLFLSTYYLLQESFYIFGYRLSYD